MEVIDPGKYGINVIAVEAERIEENLNEKLYSPEEPVTKQLSIKAVPYYYWGNRQYGEMTVWVREN